MSMIGKRRPALLFGLLFAVLLGGCGLKTPPVPPHEAVPLSIRDLQFVQDENQVVLTWTYPSRTTVGTEIPSIQSFLILRAVVPEADYCATCPVAFSSAVEVEAERAIVNAKKRQARYTEAILRPGHRYIYKVQTKAGWRLVSDDSNQVSFFWDAPAKAPEEVTAQAGDGRITLGWQPVSQLINGQPMPASVRYQVYRRQGESPFRPVGEAVTDTRYTDAGLINGEDYHYQVRAVRVTNDTRLIGLASHTVIVAPRDLTPPAPPREVSVVQVTSGFKLMWERNTEKDLAGYRIYRRLEGETKFSRIGEVDRDRMSFIDTLAHAPEGCYWAISAFDRAEPANESELSKELFHEPF